MEAIVSAFFLASFNIPLILNSKVSFKVLPGARDKIVSSLLWYAFMSSSHSIFALSRAFMISSIASPFTKTSSRPIVIPFILIT